jgi:hypothetical protein
MLQLALLVVVQQVIHHRQLPPELICGPVRCPAQRMTDIEQLLMATHAGMAWPLA